jgi:hypothetical protein
MVAKTRLKFLIAGVGLLLIVGGILVSRRARQSVPLRYAQIPEETKKFFRDLEHQGGDVAVRFTEDPVTDRWRDETNEGEDAGNGFYKIETEDFIVYYHNEGSENAKANLILGAAKRAIEPLASLFGKYFHPADVNGRKLALYICRDREEFYRLSASPNQYAVAVTSLIFSPSGTLCRGIYFAPETFTAVSWHPGDAQSSTRVQRTVWHEMAHYVFFTSLDLSKQLWHPQWVTEGIAEYASGDTDRLREIDLQNIIPLGEFESGKYRNLWLSSAYWIGYTAFLYMERHYSAERVRYFLKLSYQRPTRPSVEGAAGISFEQFDRDWQESLRTRSLQSSLPQNRGYSSAILSRESPTEELRGSLLSEELTAWPRL